ncbi:MAG: hydrolase [Chthonomonadales bacterium]|nr:hydrolase [Chthonomonadales bacterium]
MKNVGAAAFIVDGEGRVLLVKHTYGRLNWELPGGIGEVDESPCETAVREVKEETGLTVVAQHMTGYYYAPENDKLHFVYWCRQTEEEVFPRPDLAEISECGFWPVNALPRPMSDWTVQRIQDAVEGKTFALPTVIGPRVWLE